MSYFDVDVYSRQVTTTSPDAQIWFDRGLIWCFAYAHEEAAECFERAINRDPNCAMAHWGLAYATGPNYNLPWDLRDPTMRENSLAVASDAVEAALACTNVSAPEKALIEALQTRFPQREPTDLDVMRGWNDDFTEAMRRVHAAYPDDLDVRTFLVEAIMNRTPWQMWDLVSGLPNPQADTLEAQALCEDAMRDDPATWKHPGLLHLYVHLMEMSPTPEMALKAGDVLRELVPDSGHLAHMPTHIDIQCGNYHDTLFWNQRAMAVDAKYKARNGSENIYTGYRIHNSHFAAYGAMFLGQIKPALAAAEAIIEDVPVDLLRVTSPPMADYFEAYADVKDHILIRFGRWQDIIDMDMPDDPEVYRNLTAIRHYAKGVAYAATGDVENAEKHQDHFYKTRALVPKARKLHNVACYLKYEVAECMLKGEIEYRKGNYDEAFAQLRLSVAREDALPYDEPWGWMQPTRHALGALLFEQGNIDEAEIVYREDLGLAGSIPRPQIHPDNVWR
ncbi:MAG: tetratricopeptide repeat protein, partial [Boseongicola sp.]|nr:tetratricopeptide repeat protein [Boseongicola sp.]